MNCPLCNADSRVLETRNGELRRRECTNCRHRWTTVEVSKSVIDRYRRYVAAAQALASVAAEEA